MSERAKLPLTGLRVIDAATMLAAPMTATHLADFGAEVLKVEIPGRGCTGRKYGKQKNGQGVFWDSMNRNKKGITLNLGNPKGAEIFKKLVAQADVVLENYRPGTFEKWGIGWDALSELNPSLIMLRTTGWGQEGPYAHRGGFGTVAEAMSGFASTNGAAGGPPTLPGLALADEIAGYAGAMAVLTAIYERDRSPDHRGQYIDMCLYEPLMRVVEPHIIAYDQLGTVVHPVGNGSVSIAPRNAYLSKDGTWIALSGANNQIAEKLFCGMGMGHLMEDPRFADNAARVANVGELDAIISAWMKEHDQQEIVEILTKSGAVVGPMYSVNQLFDDPHFRFRESFVTVQKPDGESVRMNNVCAKFSRTPGSVRTVAPKLGEHNGEVYEKLGITPRQMEELRAEGII